MNWFLIPHIFSVDGKSWAARHMRRGEIECIFIVETDQWVANSTVSTCVATRYSVPTRGEPCRERKDWLVCIRQQGCGEIIIYMRGYLIFSTLSSCSVSIGWIQSRTMCLQSAPHTNRQAALSRSEVHLSLCRSICVCLRTLMLLNMRARVSVM